MPKVSDAHLEARRRQILDAAARCFARSGFHRTSMQDIVTESGASAGLLYRYFASKDDIVEAIVNQWHAARQERIEQHPGPAYLDLLRSVGAPEHREELRLGVQVWAEAVLTPRIRELVQRGVDGPRALVAARTDLPVDPDALARVLIAIYQGLMLQTVWDDTLDHEAYIQVVQTLLHGMDLLPPA